MKRRHPTTRDHSRDDTRDGLNWLAAGTRTATARAAKKGGDRPAEPSGRSWIATADTPPPAETTLTDGMPGPFGAIATATLGAIASAAHAQATAAAPLPMAAGGIPALISVSPPLPIPAPTDVPVTPATADLTTSTSVPLPVSSPDRTAALLDPASETGAAASALQAPDQDGAAGAKVTPISPMADWNANWRNQASMLPCVSCTGRNCTMCSIRIGGPAASNGQPTGYAPRILEYFQPAEASVMTPAAATAGAAVSAPAARSLSAPNGAQAFAATAGENPIVLENLKPGTPESEWMIGAADPSIEGYAAEFTLDHGQTVDFKINTDSTNYRIDIYRLGYYGGDGARKVATINQSLTTAQVQPVPLFDPTTKLVDAGNWSVSASWAIPSDAVSGVYIAELTRLDGSGGQNVIPFVVRDDEAPSDVTFQTSDTTWEAYNWWGGYNFYGGVDEGGRAGRADAVSYNRPFITRDGGFAAGPQDFIFGEEYPAIRWLEENGYDVNYISGLDTATNPAQLLNSKVFLSVGHDEYWSADQRSNVEAARDAGVNLAFLSGNEVYWETRWAPSIDAEATPNRTLVSYKETWDNADSDPGNITGTWRDPKFGADDPENALTGTIFTVDAYRLDTIQIPYDLSNFRFWSNTAVADIQPGQVYSLTPNLLGYEWDSDLDNGSRPAGLIDLSSTTVNVNTLLYDNGSTTGPGTSTHSLTLYRAPSGALVFGAGTVYWSWGLDSHHDNETTPTDPNVQQAMVNLFADMGVQPQTLMESLVLATQTTDHTAPTSSFTLPTDPGALTAAQPVTITGTATDSGGGIVADVEVSTDGGQSWHRADGFENWTYTWTPLAGGTYTIESRAVDDSVNMETPSDATVVTVAPGAVTSLFKLSDTPAILSESDPQPVNLGLQFTSSEAGTIVGLRFYKGLGDGGTHTVALWSSTGTLLGTASSPDETGSGWQTVLFDTPISIAAGATYVASYHSNGDYADTDGYFTTAHSNGPLTAPASNGYYSYVAGNAFPSQASNGDNYFVDVIFSRASTTNQSPVGVNDNGYLTPQNTPITFLFPTLLANDTDPDGDPLSITGAGAGSGGAVTYDSQNGRIIFTPTAGYLGPASFGYSISDGRGGTGSAIVNITVGAASLFSPSDTPAVLADPDTSQVNLGVDFTASAAGTISGIRFYKGIGDTGPHLVSLWSSTGVLLASATVSNETASGWQTATFANPVAISAGTTYVASYHSNGHYADTAGYFSTAHVSGPLTAPVGNGVYTYGTGNLFPTTTFGAANYWVDVLYNQSASAPNQPPVANNDTGLSTQQNTPLQLAAAIVLANDTDADGDPLTITGVSGASHGTVAFDAQTNTITFTPTTSYTGTAGFSYAITDGRGGTASANVTLTVTAPVNGTSLFAANATPATITENDPSAVELGMKFTVVSNGTITGIRFYKGPQNTGVHTGTLWTSTGTQLGTLTFSDETASGWQTATFATPIAVTAGTTYVVGYHSNGFYSDSNNYFTSAVSNGGITAPATGNGVYAYGSGSVFPTSTYGASNYWVDVVYQAGVAAPNQPPVANNDTGFGTQQNVPLQIGAAALLVNDTDPDGDALTVTGVSAPINGSATFNAQTNIVTFTPTAGYTGAASFTYSIADGRGGTASASASLSVTAAPVGVSLFAANATPATITVNDPSAVELGMKFTPTQDGTITGIRFYKGAQNTGVHTGTLWTSTGTQLGTLTFSNETASGWQTATFATPIEVTAGTTYVVGYHSNGFYSDNNNYFTSAVSNGPLTAPSSSTSGGNGVYAYGSGSAFPTNSYNASNYWVDVIFNGQLAA